jgi:hypothetical protein
MVATRAITIDVPPSAIWPWLVQMGVGRGGTYTYDWIERLLGLEMNSAAKIVPGLQQLEVGDVLPMRPKRPRDADRDLWIPSGQCRLRWKSDHW